jgi:hypothetical protein
MANREELTETLSDAISALGKQAGQQNVGGNALAFAQAAHELGETFRALALYIPGDTTSPPGSG